MDTKEVVSGDRGEQVDSDVVVVRTEAQWDALRKKIGVSDEQNAELVKLHGPLGAMDWGREQLVFARAGQRPSGGYRVSVYQVVRLRNHSDWRVDVQVKPPRPDRPVMQMLTNPYLVFRMRKTPGKPFYFVHDAK